MTKALRDQWAAALRSGKYQQGRLCLRSMDGNRHCCLGVLADIQGLAMVGEEPGHDTVEACYRAIEAQIGLGPRGIRKFTNLNDIEEQTFAQIADVVDTLVVTE